MATKEIEGAQPIKQSRKTETTTDLNWENEGDCSQMDSWGWMCRFVWEVLVFATLTGAQGSRALEEASDVSKKAGSTNILVLLVMVVVGVLLPWLVG